MTLYLLSVNAAFAFGAWLGWRARSRALSAIANRARRRT